MAENNQIKKFTAADIEKYWKGNLTPADMHAMEKAAMDDPFLADALEGYKNTSSYAEDLSVLQQRLDDRTKSHVSFLNLNRKKYRTLRVAAAIIIISGAGLLIEQLVFNNKKQETIVSLEKTESDGSASAAKKDIKDDSIKALQSTPDSLTPGINDRSPRKLSAPVPDRDLASEKPQNNDPAAVDVKQQSDKLLTQPAAGISANTEKRAVSEETGAINTLQNDSVKFRDETKARAAAKKNDDNYNVDNKYAGAVFANKYNYRVVDAQNNPIPFANVTNTRDNIGTYTDIRGNFNLVSTDSVLDVQVRSLGYNSANYKLAPSVKQGELILKEDEQAKRQILVQNRKLVTNISRKDSADLEEPEVGWGNYNTYVANNIRIPDNIRPKNTGSDVELSFDIDRSGNPINIKVTKSSQCKVCDEEAIRLLKEGPKWKRKGRKSKTSISIAVDRK